MADRGARRRWEDGALDGAGTVGQRQPGHLLALLGLANAEGGDHASDRHDGVVLLSGESSDVKGGKLLRNAQRVLLDVVRHDVEAEVGELVGGNPLRRPLDSRGVTAEHLGQIVLQVGEVRRIAIGRAQQLAGAGVDVLDERQLGARSSGEGERAEANDHLQFATIDLLRFHAAQEVQQAGKGAEDGPHLQDVAYRLGAQSTNGRGGHADRATDRSRTDGREQLERIGVHNGLLKESK